MKFVCFLLKRNTPVAGMITHVSRRLVNIGIEPEASDPAARERTPQAVTLVRTIYVLRETGVAPARPFKNETWIGFLGRGGGK